MENLSSLNLLLLLAAVVIAAIVVIWYAGTKLADDYGRDLRIVWYFFSLSSVCTLVAAAWASSSGAIDAAGSFRGAWGKAIESLLKFMLDLDTDVKLFATVLAVFVVPQMASYLLSGLFGRASSPILVGRAFALFVWGIVKSFVVASGILLTVAIYGGARGWVAWNVKGAVSMSILSLMLLMLAFGCLYVYRDIGKTMALPDSKQGRRLRRRLRSIRAWLTRKEPDGGAA